MSEAHVGMMVTPSVKLVRPLGAGGMGAVWVADHLALRTQVVVKFIASGLRDSKDATERFSREAAAAAQVKSPHVVQTFDHGFTAEGVPYIVMELLEGRDLGAYLDEHGRCEPELVLEIVAQLARALDRAHERGIVHRDIKPGNIFLCDAGGGETFVKLLDFGIAKGVDVPRLDSGTKTGAMIGSPFYMSPEQVLGSRSVDRKSDLWSVGVVAFESLTGRKPFDAETMGGLAIKIHSEPLPRLTAFDDKFPAALDAWFQRACARPADERFTSARELAEAFAAALGGQMPKSLDFQRVSTGPNRPSGANPREQPLLVAGATTEAGLVRSAPVARARNRLLAIVLFGLTLGLGTFAVVSLVKKGDSRETSSMTNRLSATEPPPPVPKIAEIVTAPPLQATAAKLDTPTATPVVDPAIEPAGTHLPPAKGGRPAKAGAHSKPPTASSSPSPSLPTTLPSASPPTPATAPTGHDIF